MGLVGLLNFIEAVKPGGAHHRHDQPRARGRDHTIARGQIDGDSDLSEGGAIGGWVSVDVAHSATPAARHSSAATNSRATNSPRCRCRNMMPNPRRTFADCFCALLVDCIGVGAEAYDIHSLRYTATAERARVGLGDDQIMAVSDHKTHRMVQLYAGSERQKARAWAALIAREKKQEGRQMPKRVQMRRDKPWRKYNPDAVIIARPSKWGNPFRVGVR